MTEGEREDGSRKEGNKGGVRTRKDRMSLRVLTPLLPPLLPPGCNRADKNLSRRLCGTVRLDHGPEPSVRLGTEAIGNRKYELLAYIGRF